MTAPTTPADPTGPTSPAGARSRHRRAAVGAAWEVNWRCAVLLTAAAPLALLTGYLDWAGAAATWVATLAVGVHLLALATVGFPLGIALSALLPPGTSRARAIAWFAATGAVGAAALVAWFGLVALAHWALLGAVVAGTARAWAHNAIGARAARTPARPGVPALEP